MAKKKAVEGSLAVTNGTAPRGPTGAKLLAKTKERLPCKLTPEEVQELELNLSSITCGRVAKEKEAELLLDTIKGVKERERALAERIGLAEEERDVDVHEYLLPTNVVRRVRVDTGEVVGSRTATADELQEEIPGTSADTQPPASDPGADAESEHDITDPDDFLSEDRP